MFTAYLSFQGECAEAFAAYAEIFGGEITLLPFASAPKGEGMPPLPDAQRDWIMHAEMRVGGQRVLMGADMPPQFGGARQAGVSISASQPDEASARALFERLAEGGAVHMAFGPTFFATGFGMCRDRFGTNWMISAGMD